MTGRTLQFTWADAWAYFEQVPAPQQRDFLLQVDLPTMLKRLSADQQVKVMDGAPEDIVQWVTPWLKEKTQAKRAMSFEEIAKQIARQAKV